MTFDEYEKQAMVTKNPKIRDYLLEALMGLNGEAGEAIEIVKKNMFQGHELDFEKLIEELGDALWYIAEAAHAIGVPLDTIAKNNLEKLKKRYPEGFSEKMSVYRNDSIYKLKEAIKEEFGERCV